MQDYTGQGYKLNNSKKVNEEIAWSHQEEIDKAVKEFFLKNYHTKVQVNNMVSAADGAVVYVESVKEPKFHTFAIVPIQRKSVLINNIWSLEGKVEGAIAGSLYALAFEEEFQVLDDYIQSMLEKHPIVGKQNEMIKNIGDQGYVTSYFFLAPLSKVYDELVAKYLEQPTITKQEIRKFLHTQKEELHRINVSIEFYMEEEYTHPNQEILDDIVAGLEELEGIPPGSYSVHLNDNYIDKRRGIGKRKIQLNRVIQIKF
ncbi:DUF1672 family protein [Paracerasibacillus soli]|uniref:DUF1672 family protein n=1 Tax=Paracerasibacillus soli TaxID=480284 RepID=A0ABU5CVD3_9BACI|nr:DUF1672 family protein [Virgibacillus soli]MDY0409405.1 DUF1672 family protein [Virgibacillus soli]